ncbi:MAG: bifunctional demethylmenaquinone methyltransferase/2-methoxy-6-polyprenyl-1,4-benzoquinol methylase UbiE [Phycisphaerales bacterium]|nr:bifunctional demethylmenaquinone methyltransferase/2-methoxy-6-polyprenyl-1,4-benzoquinol methylase UbiE [Phycisphaerales bacterium]
MASEQPNDGGEQRAGWSEGELRADPHAHAEKAAKVRSMFAAIAGKYDLNNRVHSFGRDQAWRREAVRMAHVTKTDRVLDVACGTGDLSRAFADAGAAHVTGLDFTQEMLDIAKTKRLVKRGTLRSGKPVIDYVQGDAMRLPFADKTFDIVSIAFGIRNVSEPMVALREFARVLKPGGRLVVLEFDQPSAGPVRWLNKLYCNKVMPITASLISRDKAGAYKYLPRSIETFLTSEALASAMVEAGFQDPQIKRLTLGVCACVRGDKPA